MKKWRLVKYVTLSVLIIFIIYILFLLGTCINDHYPYDILGATVYNWFDAFVMHVALRLYIGAIPLIIDVVLLIVSIFKLKKIK